MAHPSPDAQRDYDGQRGRSRGVDQTAPGTDPGHAPFSEGAPPIDSLAVDLSPPDRGPALVDHYSWIEIEVFSARAQRPMRNRLVIGFVPHIANGIQRPALVGDVDIGDVFGLTCGQ